MTLEEFKKRAEEDSDFCPGWDAIDAAFVQLYPGQTPNHYGTNMVKRAIFGGDQYLDGYSVYASPNGYMHIVTYGMTELYAEEEAFGGEENGWGYEMTMKLKADGAEDCLWVMDMMANLARYTYTTGNYFDPMHYVAGNGDSICRERPDSAMTSLFIVSDTEAQTQNSVYGKTAFLQLVGITYHDAMALKEDYAANAPKLYERIKADNPNFVTDLSSTRSYL